MTLRLVAVADDFWGLTDEHVAMARNISTLGRVEAALAAAGRLLDDSSAPAWWTLVDPVGDLVDITTQEGRD